MRLFKWQRIFRSTILNQCRWTKRSRTAPSSAFISVVELLETRQLLSVSAITDVNTAANRILETVADGTAVGVTVKATSTSGKSVTYSLTNDSGGSFRINANTGIVTVANSSLIDFERASSQTLTVQAKDGSDTRTANFTITVTDVKPTAPIDIDSKANQVLENALTGTPVGVVANASDPKGGTVTFSLTNNAGGRFGIDSITGVVTVANGSLLDFETSRSHSITVMAKCGSLSSTTTNITIAILNVNELPPTIPTDSNTSPNRVAENVAAGAPTGITVRSNDPDGSPITYSLTDDAGGRFVINPSTGVVAVSANAFLLNFETATSHTITVQASDGAKTGAASFIISVTNIAPTGFTDANAAVNQVVENAVTGTLVGITMSAFDPHGGPLRYSLSNDAGGRFQIDSVSGLISVANGSLLNFEVSTSHQITAVVTDGTTPPLSSTLKIAVLPGNDAPVLIPATIAAADITEDAPTPRGIVGHLVSALVSVSGTAGVRVTDEDAGAVAGMAVIEGDTTNGAWFFSKNNGTTWAPFPTISAENALLLAADSLTRIYFQPLPNFNGSIPESLTFRAWDLTRGGNGAIADTLSNGGSTAFSTATATVSLVVTPVNDAPVAIDESFTVSEDGVLSGGVLSNDSDIDGNPLTAVPVAGPSHGTLTLNANGSFTYTPTANFNGADAFTYKANDGTANSNIVTVSLTVTPVNDAPIATGESFTVAEDGVLSGNVLSNDSDIDADSLTAVLVAGPSHGTLTLNSDGSFTYTPSGNFNGADAFTYRANDGTANSNIVIVSLTVTPVNDAPVAIGKIFTVNEDNVLSGNVLGNDSDIDGDPLTAVLVAGPSHGTLNLNADGSFTYKPTADYNDADAFTYKANDGTANSNIVTVSLTITAVNDAPAATGESFTVAEDGVLSGSVLGNDSDIDGNSLTAVLVTGPSHGTLTLNSDGSFTYTLTANFNGVDAFTYKANDGTANSNVVTVSLTITPVNDAPVATGESFTVNEDNVLSGNVLSNDSDIDGNSLTALLVTGPSHGTLTLNSDGSFTYTPTGNYNGADAFTYRANDGTANSNIVIVSLTVTPVNDAPVATGESFTVNEDGVLSGSVLGNDSDIDGNSLTALLVTGPSHGALTLNADGSFTYTPTGNFNGAESFSYKANDGTANSNIVTVSLTITAVNDAPIAVGESFTVAEDVVVSGNVLINDSDIDSDPLTAVLVAGPNHGTLTLNANGSFTYTPSGNFNGVDAFTYKANDGTANSSVVTVALTITAVNDSPVAIGESFTVAEDAVVSGNVLSNDSDIDGDLLTAALVAGPTHGTLALNTDGSFTYTPAANFNGADAFTYKTNDGTADSNIVTVSLTITPVNDAPVATGESFTVNEDGVLSGNVLSNDGDIDGDPLTVALVAGPTHGTLTLNTNGSFTYTPTGNFNGVDAFTYKTNDGTANSNIVTVSLAVTPVNDAPVATGESFTVNEDAVLSGGVLGNDSDIDGNSLTALLVAGPTHGTLTLNTNGSFTYTPAANFNGADTFTYKANDGTANSNVVTVSLTVTPVNDAPVANGESFTVNEDAVLSGNVLSNDSDLDGNSLTAVLVAGPSHGTLALNSDCSFTYTPAANFNGADAFTYKANDGTANSNIVTVSLTVNPVNDAPVAVGESFTVNEDAVLSGNVLSNDSDIDGNSLTAVLVAGPTQGTLTLNTDGSFTYTPTANYNGADAFTYKANDGTANSNIVTVSLTVTPVSDAPVAIGESFTVNEDAVVSGNVLSNDSDIDADALTAVLVAGPSHGVLTLNADGSFTYTPAANFNGADAFTYKANDGTANSNIVTVSLTITAVNDAPVATGESFTVPEDAVVSGNVLGNDSDIDGNSLTAVLVAVPTHGALTLNADGSFTYTPAANFNGADAFTYKANDGTANSNIVTVSLTVNPVNDAPVATGESFAANEDSVLSGNVLSNDSDIDGNSLTAVLVAGPTHGALTLNTNGSFTYTPTGNFNGLDSFSYKANDGTANSNIVTVSITITPVNDAPVATGESFTVNEDVALSGNVLGNDSDIDGDSLTAVLVAGPSHGTLVLNANGSFTYTPTANFNGADAFTYKANDGTANSNIVTVSLTVNPVNDAPVAIGESFTVNEDDAVSGNVLGNDSDIDGNSLTAVLVAGPSHGTLTLNADGSFTYTPTANYNGADAFTYKANDGTANSNIVTVSLTVTPVNDAPIATGESFTVNEDDAVSGNVLGNDSDIDADSLTAVLVTGPSHGTLTLNADGSFTYTPTANYNGADAFTYKANDGTANSDIVTVSFTVNPVNDAPVATGESFTVNEDAVLSGSVLGNDSDLDGNSLTAVLVVGPTHGTLTLNADGSFTYTPTGNFNGEDAFTYKANDGTANSNVVTVSFTATPVNDAPVATSESFTVNEDAVLSGSVLGNDGDIDGDPLTAVLVAGPTHGTLTLNTNGSFTYTPTANFNGSDAFTYKANDGTANSNIVSVSLTIAPVNDAPVATGESFTVNEDGVSSGNVLGNDSDIESDPVTAVLVEGPSHGTLTLNSDGSFTYTPAANFNGADTITYKANDGTVNSNIVTVSLTITAVNDAPHLVQIPHDFTVSENAASRVIDLHSVFTDVDDDDSLRYSVESSDPALILVEVDTSTLTLTFGVGKSGTATIVVSATDNGGLIVTTSINATVQHYNDTIGEEQLDTDNFALSMKSAYLNQTAISQMLHSIDYPVDEIIISVKSSSARNIERAYAYLEKRGFTVREEIVDPADNETSTNDLYLIVRIPLGFDLAAELVTLNEKKWVDFAELNLSFEITQEPESQSSGNAASTSDLNDYRSLQYYLKQIDLDRALDYLERNFPEASHNPVTVAVIDTGVDYDHEDLDGHIWTNSKEVHGQLGIDDDHNGFIDDVNGWDFVGQAGYPRYLNTVNGVGEDFEQRDNDPNDFVGHGTHVAGIIAAERDVNGAVKGDGQGIDGVAPFVEIMPLRAGYAAPTDRGSLGGNFTTSDVLKAFSYASRNGARVINASFGGNFGESAAFTKVITKALKRDVLIVAAAGNDSIDFDANTNLEVNQFPATYAPKTNDSIISVASSTRAPDMEHPDLPNLDLSPFSNRGSVSVDIAAPGLQIISTIPEFQSPSYHYNYMTGTSMAAPQVSGVAAILLSAFPQATALQVKQAILAGAYKYDTLIGHVSSGGQLNAFGALTQLENILRSDSTRTLKARNFTLNTEAGKAILINPIDSLGNTSDQQIHLSAVGSSNYGEVQFDGGGPIRYTPAAGFVGVDIFEYTLDGDDGQNSTGIISVNVINAPPIAVPDVAATRPDKPVFLHVLDNDRDNNGDEFEVSEFTQPIHGTVHRSVDHRNVLVYTPSEGFEGSDAFIYRVWDDKGAEAQGAVTVNVVDIVRPTNLGFDDVGRHSITVTWNHNDPLPGLDGFRILYQRADQVARVQL